MSDSVNEIRVVLVDDHTLFRNGLKGLISGRRNCSVVGEFGNGKEFLSFISSRDADVVFMDYAMPEMNGYEATKEALKIRPDLRIICLSMYGEERYYSQMVEAGAMGFLQKDSDIEEVFLSIETVMSGEGYFSQSLMKSIGDTLRHGNSATDSLSDREIDVLVGICRGESTQAIADSLFISKRTVDTHRANILEKTGCNNTASLVVYALKNHLIDI